MTPRFDIEELSSIPDPLAVRAAPIAAPVRPSVAPGPTRSTVRMRRVLSVIFGVAWLVAIQLVIGIRTDLPPLLYFAHVGVPALLGGVAMWIALRPGPAGLGPSVKAMAIFVAVAPVAFAGAALCGPCVEQGLALAESIFLCGDFIIAIAILPLLALVWAQRRTWAAGSGFRSVMLGAAVGFTAAGMQALHCAHSDRYHVLVGHGWPVIFIALLGYFAIRRTMRIA